MRFGSGMFGALCLSGLALCAHAAPSQVAFTPMPPGSTLASAYGFQDTKTCLVWGRNPNGFGIATPYQYINTAGDLDGATVRIKKFALGGYSDWRLPTIAELQELFADNTGKLPPSTWNTQTYPNVLPGQFWSSTLGGNYDPYTPYTGLVYVLDYVGQVHPEALGNAARYTWPVRYQPCAGTTTTQ